MSQLDEQFITKGIFYLKTALAIFSGSGDPNSVEDGALGCLYIDEASGDLYQKTTALGTLTGWSLVSGGGGGGTPGGSNTEVQYNNAGAFGGISGVTSDGTSLFISALNLQADQPTFLNDVAFIKNAIGAVTDDGINLVNTTAAALGSQQFSPGIRWTGNGWKTSSGGASQAMDAIAQLETVQGAAVPTSNLCFSFQSNGTGYTKRFTFSNTGSLTLDQTLNALSANLSGNLSLATTSQITWNSDLYLQRDAANTLALRNGANAQTLLVYNTYTDASNYERFEIVGAGSQVILRNVAAGSGTVRQLAIGQTGADTVVNGTTIYLQSSGSNRWLLNASGHLTAITDNTYDIGASGANRPRNVYVGSNISVAGQVNSQYFSFVNGGTTIYGISDGVIRLSNGAGTDFDRLQFGGTSASYPAIKRSSTTLQIRLADDSAFAPLTANLITAKGNSGASDTSRIINIETATVDLGGFTIGGSHVQTNLGTAPSASVTDATLGYTKDVATGKAEKFYRNEYGEITRVTACTRVLTEDFGVGSTALADVTATSIYGALSFDVEASTPYRFRAFLRVAADATGGFKVAINGTATATTVWYNIQAMGISAGSVINTLWTSLGSSSGTNGVTDYFVQIEGYILVNAAGTLTVQFANNSATGTSLCKEGSSFTIAQGNR